MRLSSPAFSHNELIPPRYTCDGADINPPLTLEDVPKETQSLTLIMDDPDAPAGTWDHWIVFNIPPDASKIAEGAEPRGVHGKGTGGNTNYHGPCPPALPAGRPDREHRYFFKIYALDCELTLPEGASKKDVEQAMAEHILDQTELIGRYERQ